MANDFHLNVLIVTMMMNVVDVLMMFDDDSMNNYSMDLTVDVFLLNDDDDHVRNHSNDLYVFSFSNNNHRRSIDLMLMNFLSIGNNDVNEMMTNNTNDFDSNHHVLNVLMMMKFVGMF